MKKYFLFVSVFFYCHLFFGQSSNWSWANGAGGSNADQSQDLTVDIKGNVYITGEFYSPEIAFGNDTLTNTTIFNFSDFFLTKYNSAGNVVWAKSFGSTSHEFGRSITTDKQGNVYVTGEFYSPFIALENDTLINFTGAEADVFIVKYDSLGNVIWARSFGGDYHDAVSSITIDTLDNIYVAGVFYSSEIILGNDTLINKSLLNAGDGFVAKYSSSGNIIWARCFGGFDKEIVDDIAVDYSGNIYATGGLASSTINFGADTMSNLSISSSYLDIFIVKYDSSGNEIWAKSYGGIDSDWGRCIKTDANGNVVCTGVFQSSTFTIGSYVLNNSGGQDIFIIKYDNAGNLLWVKREGGDLYDISRDISISPEGNIFMAGTFRNDTLSIGSYLLTSVTNNGTDDIFIVEYDIYGNPLGTITAGGDDMDYVMCIGLDKYENIYISGGSDSPNITFDDVILDLSPSAGNRNIFTAKHGKYTSTDIRQQADFNASVSPNPTKDYINIFFQQEYRTSVAIEMLDIQGKIVYAENQSNVIGSYGNTIKLDNYNKGVYFLRLTTSDKRITRKIILN